VVLSHTGENETIRIINFLRMERTMKRTALLFLFLLSGSAMLLAQAAAPAKAAPQAAPNFSEVLNRQIANLENELVPAADAMPEDKYNYQTTKDTMPFSRQVLHAAATNYYYCSVMLGEKPPVDLGKDGDGPEFKSKAQAVQFMKDSFAYAKKAFATIDAQNAVTSIAAGQRQATRLGLAFNTIAHGNNHYGQIVQYLRVNGVVPPASRPK
jgi:uncharacterized damage-inducible protein DinB